MDSKALKHASSGSPLFWLFSGVAIGVAASYFMDPQQGQERLSRLKDQIRSNGLDFGMFSQDQSASESQSSNQDQGDIGDQEPASTPHMAGDNNKDNSMASARGGSGYIQ